MDIKEPTAHLQVLRAAQAAHLKALRSQEEVSSPMQQMQEEVPSPIEAKNLSRVASLSAKDLSGVASPSEAVGELASSPVDVWKRCSHLPEQLLPGLAALQEVAMIFVVRADEQEWQAHLDKGQRAGLSLSLRGQVLGICLHTDLRRRLFESLWPQMCSQLSVVTLKVLRASSRTTARSRKIQRRSSCGNSQ